MTAVEGLLTGLVVGALCGLLVGLVATGRRHGAANAAAARAEGRLGDAQAAMAQLAGELQRTAGELEGARSDRAHLAAEVELLRRSADERVAEREQEHRQLAGEFAQLSDVALQRNTEQFLLLADARLKESQVSAEGDLARRQEAIARLLQPLYDSLSRYEHGLRQLEHDRQEAYAGLTAQVRQIGVAHEQLQRETRNLVTALRSPQTRGRWGELQLRRVVEMAGLVAHCDFDEQVVTGDESGRLRPDLVVHLPGGAQVVVDAKVPLEAFLKAADAEDEEGRRRHLAVHARQLRTHVDQLAKKQYWSQFDPSPDFVVAFVPGDPLLAAAYEHDPALVEHALDNRVLLTTPTTLVALLRTVGHSWRQEALAENARLVQQLGTELYDRLRVMGGHLGKLQRSLSGAVEAFNETVGSLESRVLVTARRFPELGVGPRSGKVLAEVPPITTTARAPQSPELAGEGLPTYRALEVLPALEPLPDVVGEEPDLPGAGAAGRGS
jgi:DNA recombination protein RmuC